MISRSWDDFMGLQRHRIVGDAIPERGVLPGVLPGRCDSTPLPAKRDELNHHSLVRAEDMARNRSDLIMSR